MRIPWIDSTKALAIILIVLGHTHGLSPRLRLEIYSFHIPLFLMLSGILTSEESLKKLGRKTLPLFKPYLIYGAVGYLFWLPWREIGDGGTPTSFWVPLWGMLYGVSGRDYLMPHNPPLWYFPMYLSCLVFAWIACRGKIQATTIYVLAVLFLLLAHLLPVELPWASDKALIGLLFFKTGQLIKPSLSKMIGSGTRPQSAVIALALLVANVVGARLNGMTNLNLLDLGYSPILFLFNGITGSIAFILVAGMLPANRITSALASNTIPIFCIHILILRVLPLAHLSPQSSLGAVVAAIVISLLIAFVVEGMKSYRKNRKTIPVQSPTA